MKGRLLQSIIGTILEELAIVAVWLWGLPRLGVRLPIWGLIIVMVVWAAYTTLTHRLGTRALMRKQLTGQTNMVGCDGIVARRLKPEGLVKIKGELWAARSEGGELREGSPVTVIGQERLKLIVRECSNSEIRN